MARLAARVERALEGQRLDGAPGGEPAGQGPRIVEAELLQRRRRARRAGAAVRGAGFAAGAGAGAGAATATVSAANDSRPQA
jgi:hypothetical protein